MIRYIRNLELYDIDVRPLLMAFFIGGSIEVLSISEGNAKTAAEVDGIKGSASEDMITVTAVFDEDVKLSVNGREGSYETVITEGDYRVRRDYRNVLKLALYRLLVSYTGEELPWGDLTGVRPTQIAMKMLCDGASDEEIAGFYKSEFAVSEAKARLSTEVAKKELKLKGGADLDNAYCLYIGIPFCPSRCLYCSFTSYPIALYKDMAQTYIDRLAEELKLTAKMCEGRELKAVYIGGGTPSSLSEGRTERLMIAVTDAFPRAKDTEFTVEAGRPDSITRAKLDTYLSYGVDRISINPQTMNGETLKVIGRAHTPAQTVEAFAMAREAGFKNINTDLIAGLPGEDVHSMEHTLNEIRKLAPESLTVHSLALKRAAALSESFAHYKTGINRDMEAMHDMAREYALSEGLKPYYLYRQKSIGGNLENVGYAKEGCECLYNVLIMEEFTDIMSAGAGAVTKLIRKDEAGNRVRVDAVANCKSVTDYIDRFDEFMDKKKNSI